MIDIKNRNITQNASKQNLIHVLHITRHCISNYTTYYTDLSNFKWPYLFTYIFKLSKTKSIRKLKKNYLKKYFNIKYYLKIYDKCDQNQWKPAKPNSTEPMAPNHR